MNDERIELAKYAIRCASRASALVKEALNVQREEERDHLSTGLAVDKIGRLNAAASADQADSIFSFAVLWRALNIIPHKWSLQFMTRLQSDIESYLATQHSIIDYTAFASDRLRSYSNLLNECG